MIVKYALYAQLTTLARMRWISGCSTKKMAETFEVEERTILGYLRELKNGRLQRLKLTEEELAFICREISEEVPYGKIS